MNEKQVRDTLKTLTDREKDVFNLILKGWKNREIADELFIEEQSVTNVARQIYNKFDIDDEVGKSQPRGWKRKKLKELVDPVLNEDLTDSALGLLSNIKHIVADEIIIRGFQASTEKINNVQRKIREIEEEIDLLESKLRIVEAM